MRLYNYIYVCKRRIHVQRDSKEAENRAGEKENVHDATWATAAMHEFNVCIVSSVSN